jgi:thiamine pyrophosphate-dependent acetolactate synthase large subunit-like protein
VLLVIGDGGFMLGGLTEFHTAVRAGIDLTVMVCNDGGYGAEHIQFRTRNLAPDISLIPWPDFAGVAAALGGEGVTVRSDAELEAVRGRIAQRSSGKPLLIDLRLDPDRVPGD